MEMALIIGHNIKTIRTARDISQKELASRAGVGFPGTYKRH